MLFGVFGVEKETKKPMSNAINNTAPLPARLPTLVRLFAEAYDASIGGYLVPPNSSMKRFTEADVTGWIKRYASEPQYDSVELEVASFLYSLLRMTGGKRVLETGCSRGFSTSFLATAVTDNGDGGVISIDADDLFHLWEGSEVEPAITFINANSLDVVGQVRELLNGEMFDLLFLDSLHTYAHLMAEIMLYERLLKTGGMIVLHDTIFYDCLAPVVMQLSECPRFEVITLPSPRKHAHGTRCPGVTIATKITDDVERHPLRISQTYFEWVSDIVNLPGKPDRNLMSEPMLDIMRREKKL
jgi:predicted O-methyltransferase YrrM